MVSIEIKMTEAKPRGIVETISFLKKIGDEYIGNVCGGIGKR